MSVIIPVDFPSKNARSNIVSRSLLSKSTPTALYADLIPVAIAVPAEAASVTILSAYANSDHTRRV